MARSEHNPFDEVETTVHPQYQSEAEPPQAFVLTVQQGTEAGQQYAIDPSAPSPLLIGQSPACAVRLSDRSVSRRHAALEIEDGRLRVRDLDSTNGTWIHDVAVRDAYLRGGELLRVGDTAFRVDQQTASAMPLPAATHFGRLVGASPEMRKLYPLLERLAASDIPVVIEGETGTGKEALAEAIHEQGSRAGGPFVVFDCTAAPANLLESELFGHERGAFTGAVQARPGVFQQADGGTLLIDEIGELDVTLQPKLLRAIERAEVRSVGGTEWTKVDVRVLAATRRDLDREVQEGRFRDDLFHRLAVGRIELPPLRRRRGDVAVLARHFWKKLGGGETPLPSDLLARWQREDWPGNVRELRNAVARRLALGDLAASMRKPTVRRASTPTQGFIDQVIAEQLALPTARVRIVEEFERRYIAAVLESHDGHVTRAAEAAGVARRYFQLLRKRRKQ